MPFRGNAMAKKHHCPTTSCLAAMVVRPTVRSWSDRWTATSWSPPAWTTTAGSTATTDGRALPQWPLGKADGDDLLMRPEAALSSGGCPTRGRDGWERTLA